MKVTLKIHIVSVGQAKYKVLQRCIVNNDPNPDTLFQVEGRHTTAQLPLLRSPTYKQGKGQVVTIILDQSIFSFTSSLLPIKLPSHDSPIKTAEREVYEEFKSPQSAA